MISRDAQHYFRSAISCMFHDTANLSSAVSIAPSCLGILVHFDASLYKAGGDREPNVKYDDAAAVIAAGRSP